MAEYIFLFGVPLLIGLVLYLLSPRSSIPGPIALPIFGNLFLLGKAKPGKHYLIYKELAKKFGAIYRVFLGRQLVVRLNTYEVIHEAFVEKADVFSGRPDFLHNEGKGLLCNHGDQYKSFRQVLLEKMLSLDKLVTDNGSYQDKILRETQVLIEHLKKYEGGPVVIDKLCFSASCNIILDILFGVRHKYEDKQFIKLVEADMACSKDLPPASVLGLLFPVLQNILPKVKKSSSQMTIHNYAETLIKECRKTYDDEHIKCLVDAIIQAERRGEVSSDVFSDCNILCAVSDILFAAIGNIGVVLSWCIVYMIRYPEVQVKCQNEIRSNVGNERQVRLQDIEKLNYVQATITEIERLATTAPITVPHVATEDGTIKGYHIPKGTILVGDIMAAYVTNLKNGEDFTPERHLNTKGQFVKSENNLAFGIGQRKCLGDFLAEMEVFLLLSNLLQQLTFTKVTPSDDFNFEGHLGLLMTTPDFQVKITKNPH